MKDYRGGTLDWSASLSKADCGRGRESKDCPSEESCMWQEGPN